jgi:hypothetical protein
MSFSSSLQSVLAEYFPENTAPIGLDAKIEAVYDSSDNIGAFDISKTLAKYSDKQVNVSFDDHNLAYEITYVKDAVTSTKTFFGSIPNGVHATDAEVRSAVQYAFREAVFHDGTQHPKNIADTLEFNALWVVGSDNKLKLLIPTSVSGFAITSLKYKTPINATTIVNTADNTDIVSAVVAWDGDLLNIPVEGYTMSIESAPQTVDNHGKIRFVDASGKYFFGNIANGANSTGEALEAKLKSALDGAFYLDATNVEVNHTTVTVSFDSTLNVFNFDDSATVKASKFISVNQNAYSIYKITDQAGFLSGLKVSQVDLDNRTGNFSGSVVIDASNNKLKYEVTYIAGDKSVDIETYEATLTAGTYSLSALATELTTQLNTPIAGEHLGAWDISVNKIQVGAELVDTNNLKVVFDAKGLTGATGRLDASSNGPRSIVKIRFVDVANDAVADVKFNGQLHDNVLIKNNIVYNATEQIKFLPDAGFVIPANAELNYQIVYKETATDNVYSEIKTAPLSGTHETVEELATHIKTQLGVADASDARWDVSWNQATEKFGISYTGVDRSQVQIKFIANATSALIGITQVEYNAPASTLNIQTNSFVQPYITIPADASLNILIAGNQVASSGILSRSYLSGDRLASEIDSGDLAVFWDSNKIQFAYNTASDKDDIVTIQANSVALRELLKLGGSFFVDNGIVNNSSHPLATWEGVANETVSIRLAVPEIKYLFPVAVESIKARFFADASDNILDIFKLTNGLRDVILENAMSYQSEIGMTASNHVQNDLLANGEDLTIKVYIGSADDVSGEHYTVTLSADGKTRTYEVIVKDERFAHNADADKQALIQNFIEKTYSTSLYEIVRDNIQAKVKELIEFVLHEWSVAVNADPNVSEYLTNNVLSDLKDNILGQIAPESNSIFSLIPSQQYATLVQAFQEVIPEGKGSAYIALRTLEGNNYLADPVELFNALRKDVVNIYDYAQINSVAQKAKVEEFLREYFDRLLRSYAEFVKDKYLNPADNDSIFKPANIAVALAAAGGISSVGVKGSSGNDDGEYFNGMTAVADFEETATKLSNVVNAIAHNAFGTVDRKTSQDLLRTVLTESVSPLEDTLILLDGSANVEADVRTPSLGLQSNPNAGLTFLTTIMLSHHLLHKILADGSGSLFNDSSKLTKARWDRLMLAYEQEGRCLPVGVLSGENYSDMSLSAGSELERLKRLSSKLYEVFETLPTTTATLVGGNPIANLHTFLNDLYKKIEFSEEHEGFTVVAVSGAVTVDPDNHVEYLLEGIHEDKLEGILRYYVDTLYDFIVLESPTAFAVQVKNSDLGKGLTHSLFYRLALDNKFEDILKVLGNHFSTATYFDNLGIATVSSLATPLADSAMDISGELWTHEQINEVIIRKSDPLKFLNDKMRVRIYGEILREDPATDRVSMTATPEMQAQVNQMKFYDSYLTRFTQVDQGLIMGLLIQHHKRIEQQEATAPNSLKLAPVDYLNEMFSYLDTIIKKKHVREAQFASLTDPFPESSSTRSISSRSIIASTTSASNTLTKARDVITIGDIFEISRLPALDLWKADILAAVNIEKLRFNLEAGSANDISEFLNMYESAVAGIEQSIVNVINNKAVVDRTMELLTVGLGGSVEDKVIAIEEAVREQDALNKSKVMMDSLVVVVGILNVKLEQLVAAQQKLDEKIADYNRLIDTLQTSIADLQNVYSALPPQYNNFADLAQSLSACLNVALTKRDEVSGKVGRLRLFLDNVKSGYALQKDFSITQFSFPSDLGRGFNVGTTNQKLFK